MKLNKNIAISDTGFLFNPANGESFSVNPIGVEVITMLKEGKSLEVITKALVSGYDTDKTTIEKDIYDFVSILKSYSLVNGDEKK